VHSENVLENVRLVSGSLTETDLLSSVEVVQKHGLVVRVRTVLNDDTSTLARSKTTEVGVSLLGDVEVDIVLGLVNVGGHGNNARDTGGVSLGGTGRGSVHDGDLSGTQEISRSSESVEHTGSVDTGGVGVSIDVELNGGVHSDNTETTDDLGVVGNGLGTEEQLVVVVVPVTVEALESIRGETDGGSGGEVQVTGIEEVQEGVLENLSPDGKVTEVVTLGESSDNGVGDVTNSGLEGQEGGRKTLGLNLTLQEGDKVGGDGLGDCVLGGVVGSHVGKTGLDNADNLVRVARNGVGSNAVLGGHDKVGLAAGGLLSHDNVVESLHGGGHGVELNDDLVGGLDDLGGGSDGSSGNDSTVLSDSGGLNDGDVEHLSVGTVLGVVSVQQVSGEHGQVLVEEVDASLVDSLGNGLSDLVGSTTGVHVQVGPSSLSLSSGRGSDEERVVGGSLEVVLLDVVGEGNGEDLGVSDT
jgi:hypothetical protein